jgi:hypothetical protein
LKSIFLTIFFFIALRSGCFAQKLQAKEWCWALGHPFAALKVKSVNRQCQRTVNLSKVKLELDSFSNGGKLDAFRHLFYMAAFAQKVKARKLRKLGRAHERTNYKMFKRSGTEFGELPDSLSTVMDLMNNELAFQIGAQNKNLSLGQLQDLVIKEIRAGKAMIMKRDKDGRYLDCSGMTIDLPLREKKWNLPKCLVASDFEYR